MIGTTLGHYRIVEQIGAGGMGVVYRAHDERLDRDVAIKVLPEEVANDPDRLRLFEREAKAVAQLDHPNILAIHDFGTEGGVTYAVMELLKGVSLRDVISRVGVAPGKAVEHARSIAEGLAAAHDQGIVHRDLKPENVFLTKDGRIKILDFGLAKLKVREVDLTTGSPTETLGTVPGTLLGTIPYMAPEQLQGQAADHRSDIFALGVVLYEMLTGHRPFGGSTTVETAAAILKEDPEPILAVSPNISPALAAVVAKCLEKRPEDRFNSAHDLSITLDAIDRAAPPTPKADRSVIVRRWPHALAIAIAAVIALLVILPPEALFERRADEPSEAQLPRIVVLPFENLGSPEDEYFADGITEEIISRLSAVSGLQVISRTSAMYYKDRRVPIRRIGDELDVEYVLEGTIRWDRSGEGHGRVRITPQLIKVADDSQLWSDRYDREMETIFIVQSEIAEQVIAQLRTTVLEPERSAINAQPTDNMEAYQAYLLGVQYSSWSDEERYERLSIQMLELAVELDPDFAVAHARLSEAHSMFYTLRYDFTPERLAMAKASAERALELQPGLPEGHEALGAYHYWGFRDYKHAIEQFEIASEKLPVHNKLCYVYRRQGRWNDALEELVRWRRIDPQAFFVAFEASAMQQDLRDYKKAEEEAKRAIAIGPNQPDAYIMGARIYVLWDGATDRARRLLESAPSQESPAFAHLWIQLDLYDRKPEMALARLQDAAIDASRSVVGYLPRGWLRCVCLSEMGEVNAAAEACESAVEQLKLETEARPYDYDAYSALGRAYALLDRSEEAVRAGEHAVELVPISKDVIDGAAVAVELAKIYTGVGETDKALDLIEDLLSIPCDLSVGLLRLDPVWDPLRDHPRFQALLERHDERSNVETLER